MKHFRFFSLLFITLLVSRLVGAQVLVPTHLSTALSQPKAAVGTELELLINARIDPKWHLYATDFGDDVGPVVFTLKFQPSPAYELVGKPVSVKSHHVEDPVFKGEVAYWEGTGQIRQRIKVLQPGALSIKADADYQSCTDVDGQCVPGNAALAFGPITVTGAADAASTKPSLPVSAAPTSTAPVAATTTAAAAIAAAAPPVAAPTVLAAAPTASVTAPASATATASATASAAAEASGAEGPVKQSLLALPNLIFFTVFVVFGLSFLGLFEITLPNGMVNKIDAQADKGGWGGVFFMALTLVVVSFSCTGPIVASILGLAARGERITPIVGMVGFSLAFALPFTLFAIFPSMLKSLPRSGGWLNTVKVVLGFVELMLALKFLSMADLAYHWNLLPRDIYLVLWIALSGLLGLYLLGRYRLSHDSAIEHLSVGRLLMAVLAFSFMTYLIPGLFGAPLPLLAGYLPPQSSHDFSIANAEGGAAPTLARGSLPAQCEVPRYAEFLELPHQLPGYFDLEQAKRCAKAQNKPLFIDFTGHACVNCRKMEASVWSDPQVLKRLREDYVVVALYVDDKAELPTAEQYVSPRDKQLKTTLGKRNADLQITRYGFNAQPYYVVLDPTDPTDKPLTTPIAYEPSVAKFSEFLDRGKSQYRQHKTVARR
ncbi:MAG: DUF255 domain-containing protein [Cytophagaceae bacterium]|nr:MAG: DUF255 domain-containing protein [Cytophagaceae bacterium]